jgi:hypothetical protein
MLAASSSLHDPKETCNEALFYYLVDVREQQTIGARPRQSRQEGQSHFPADQ